MKNHWKGKLWYAYGTSMTSVQQGEFVPVVEKLSGLKVVNKGIPGGSLTPSGFGKGNTKRAVMNLDDGKTQADLITLEVLPNEGPPAGDIFDNGDDSYCGCLNQCLRYLQENTKAQIVLIIMIGGNNLPPEAPTQMKKTTNYEFAYRAREVARINSVPVIDIFSESGLGYARVKNKDYQLDNIHLNKRGGLIMGNFVWSKLKDIPLFEP